MSLQPPLFAHRLITAGWVPVRHCVFAFFFFEINEIRYRSPYTGKVHKLHKALRKEMKMEDVATALFI